MGCASERLINLYPKIPSLDCRAPSGSIGERSEYILHSSFCVLHLDAPALGKLPKKIPSLFPQFWLVRSTICPSPNAFGAGKMPKKDLAPYRGAAQRTVIRLAYLFRFSTHASNKMPACWATRRQTTSRSAWSACSLLPLSNAEDARNPANHPAPDRFVHRGAMFLKSSRGPPVHLEFGHFSGRLARKPVPHANGGQRTSPGQRPGNIPRPFRPFGPFGPSHRCPGAARRGILGCPTFTISHWLLFAFQKPFPNRSDRYSWRSLILADRDIRSC